MNKLHLPDYNLEATLLGGQSFSWDYADGYFWGFTQNRAVKIKRDGDDIYWQTYPKKNDTQFIKNYLKADVRYPRIISVISKDKHIRAALAIFPNLRILKQDFDQTLLSFIISANNNIRAIRNIIRRMNAGLGSSVSAGGRKIYLFPKTEAIASAPIKKLLSFKMGFRAKYVRNAARHLVKTGLSSRISKMSEEEARNALKEIPGVGDKIADCVLVYALGFDNVMPLDVWGKRVATDLYGLTPKMKYSEMRGWFGSYFNGYAAWAGQFLFEYMRNSHARGTLAKSI